MPFHTKEEIEHRLMLVSEQYMLGVPQFRIADMAKVTPSQVSQDLKALRQRWRDTNLSNIDDIITDQLVKLDRMESELWDAWERSKRDFIEHRKKGTGLATVEGKDGKDDEMIAISEVTHTTKEKEPNAAYMSGILAIIDKRLTILGVESGGLNADKTIKVTIKA
jgi:hypothetical protein